MKKIIYIAGLGHSGSTVLDMSLGSHRSITGLGEIYVSINNRNPEKLYKNSTCSCGEKAESCVFWKRVKDISFSYKSTKEKYIKLIEVFNETFGNEVILVDSSKNSYPYLKYLNENFDLRLVYISRDFRSWSYARHVRTGKPLFYLFRR